MATKSDPEKGDESKAVAASARRPRELQDALNRRIFHPLAWRLALRLAPTFVTPNMVSIAGGLLVVAAAVAYVQPGWPVPALIGFALHLGWHVVDGADGDLARLTGRSGPAGELVDGICDYASHIVLYLTLGALLQHQVGAWTWVLTVGAGASRIIQANHYEVQRRQYQWWVYGVPWLRTSAGEGALSPFGAAYLQLAQRIGAQAPAIDAALDRADGDPARLEQIRAAIRRRGPALLGSLLLLGANYRTIGLGLSMLAGSPLYFFLFEGVLLNLLLWRSIIICNTALGQVIADVEPRTDR